MSRLEAVERVLDAIPRAQGARVAHAGGFTLFLRDGPGWPWCGRPSGGPPDVGAARAALREHGSPEVLEWVHDLAPGLADEARAAGLAVARRPLLVLHAVVAPPLPDGAAFGEAPLEEVLVAQAEGFGGGADLTHLPVHRAALDDGGAALACVVDDDGEVLGVAMAQLAAGGAELVGIATIERARRRGIAAALAAELARRLEGCEPVFLSAGGDAAARVYERAGFVRVGTSCAAQPVS